MHRTSLFILTLLIAIFVIFLQLTAGAIAENVKVTIRDQQTQKQLLTGQLTALSCDTTSGLIIIISNPSLTTQRGTLDGIPVDIFRIDIITKPP